MAPNTALDAPRRGSHWRILGWSLAALLLLLPLVAMQFTGQVNWSAADFMLAGALIGGTGAAFELAAHKTRNPAYRAAVAVALAAAFLLVWINGAVGLIGSEDNPANLMFGGVLAVAVAGAIVAWFQPHGMARAFLVTAVAQALVGAIALIAGLGASGPIWPWDVAGLTGFFTATWLLSAWFFSRAARASSSG